RVQLGIFSVLINVFGLVALSLEFWDYFGKTSFGTDRDLARNLSLSILWAIYATALILVGVQQKSALLRWQALLLFGLVVVKVFLFDLAFLDRAYRIFSFFVLGSVLLVISFLYTRRLSRGRSTCAIFLNGWARSCFACSASLWQAHLRLHCLKRGTRRVTLARFRRAIRPH